MKNTGFQRPTYEEALQKKISSDEKKRNKPKSAATKAGAKRTYKEQNEHSKAEWHWKLAVRTRDNYQCQYPRCKARNEHIHCHHIAPRSQRKDLIYIVTNGTSLCEPHHSWTHANHAEAEKLGLFSLRSIELATKEGTIGVY